MIHSIFAGLVGVAFTLLALVAIYYGARVKSAEKDAFEAWALAKQCMDAKEAAESGFKQAKEFFEELKKQPTVAIFTPEQIEDLSRQLGHKMFLYGSTGTKQ